MRVKFINFDYIPKGYSQSDLMTVEDLEKFLQSQRQEKELVTIIVVIYVKKESYLEEISRKMNSLVVPFLRNMGIVIVLEDSLFSNFTCRLKVLEFCQTPYFISKADFEESDKFATYLAFVERNMRSNFLIEALDSELILNLDTRTVKYQGSTLSPSPNVFRALALLVANLGRLVPDNLLSEFIWGHTISRSYLSVLLRIRLEKEFLNIYKIPLCIKRDRRGRGYILKKK